MVVSSLYIKFHNVHEEIPGAVEVYTEDGALISEYWAIVTNCLIKMNIFHLALPRIPVFLCLHVSGVTVKV